MIVKCIDINNTWRNSLTLAKEYEAIRSFPDSYTGNTMLEIKCDDGVIRPYRADRFESIFIF